jgi:glycerol uptake facilitator-like aquaporin
VSCPVTDPPTDPTALSRRAAVEAVGTAGLVMVVVGSGIQATRLTGDAGLQLLANSTATVLGLGVLVALFGPVSGAHLNPVVTLVAWASKRKSSARTSVREPAAYVAGQLLGAAAGVVLANAMFGLPLVQLATRARSGSPLWLAEVVATAGLVLLVFGLARTGRETWAPAAVAAYIGAAYWFTSSTSFANPAVTLARALSNTFAGIAPASVPPFIAAQLLGAVVGAALLVLLFGHRLPLAADVVLPHGDLEASTQPASETSASPVTREESLP